MWLTLHNVQGSPPQQRIFKLRMSVVRKYSGDMLRGPGDFLKWAWRAKLLFLWDPIFRPRQTYAKACLGDRIVFCWVPVFWHHNVAFTFRLANEPLKWKACSRRDTLWHGMFFHSSWSPHALNQWWAFQQGLVIWALGLAWILFKNTQI